MLTKWFHDFAPLVSIVNQQLLLTKYSFKINVDCAKCFTCINSFTLDNLKRQIILWLSFYK